MHMSYWRVAPLILKITLLPLKMLNLVVNKSLSSFSWMYVAPLLYIKEVESLKKEAFSLGILLNERVMRSVNTFVLPRVNQDISRPCSVPAGSMFLSSSLLFSPELFMVYEVAMKS